MFYHTSLIKKDLHKQSNLRKTSAMIVFIGGYIGARCVSLQIARILKDNRYLDPSEITISQPGPVRLVFEYSFLYSFPLVKHTILSW